MNYQYINTVLSETRLRAPEDGKLPVGLRQRLAFEWQKIVLGNGEGDFCQLSCQLFYR